jgi:DNA-binding GntR family transcriptional regulator
MMPGPVVPEVSQGKLPMSTISLAAAPSFSVRPLNTNMSFREQAYAVLKQAIANADVYDQHEEIRLDEKELSQALGVSRTPIREAMTLLEQEGFLRTLPRRGIFIVRKTKRDIIDMIQMWAALESMSARLATLHATDKDIASLRHMFDSFADTTPTAHLEEYSDANLAFHQAIFKLGGSPLMIDTVQNLLIHVRAIRKMTISKDDRATRSIVDHMKIIDALEKRDTELAERLVRGHTLGLAAYVEKYCDFLT